MALLIGASELSVEDILKMEGENTPKRIEKIRNILDYLNTTNSILGRNFLAGVHGIKSAASNKNELGSEAHFSLKSIAEAFTKFMKKTANNKNKKESKGSMWDDFGKF